MKMDGLKLLLAGLFLASVVGCDGGDTDGGKAADETFEGSQFVPNEQNSGSLRLDVNQDEIPVAQTSGFTVTVRDSAGAPVSDVTIACDSEQGVAILEPTTGAEITSGSGIVSGRIGCEVPGSFQFGCRLPVGGNLRQFVRIKCTGDVPTGFTGFEGAAGGGLGTGGVTDDEQNDGDVRVASISIDDTAGEAGGVQVDINRVSDCDGDATTSDPEPFGDTFADIKVVNDTNSVITINNLRVQVPGVGTSSNLNIIGENTVQPDGGEATFRALIFSVVGPGNKNLIRGSTSSSNVALTSGVKNVRFTLTGTDGRGNSVSTSGGLSISFAGYNHCG